MLPALRCDSERAGVLVGYGSAVDCRLWAVSPLWIGILCETDWVGSEPLANWAPPLVLGPFWSGETGVLVSNWVADIGFATLDSPGCVLGSGFGGTSSVLLTNILFKHHK